MRGAPRTPRGTTTRQREVEWQVWQKADDDSNLWVVREDRDEAQTIVDDLNAARPETSTVEFVLVKCTTTWEIPS